LRITDMPDRPFPFSRDASTMPAMSIEADLALRGPREFLRPRLSWPVDSPYGRPIAVHLADPDSSFELADALCLEAGYIVLALRTPAVDVATIAVEWTADHARQLGGDPDQLLVAGGRLAAIAAVHARDEGWPFISRQVLIGPDIADWPLAGASLAGVAPATVVNAPRYASRLRDSGVEVVEIERADPMSLDWISGLRSDDDDYEEPESEHRD
jgi:hypothetical protein